MDAFESQDAEPMVDNSFYQESIKFYLNYCKHYPIDGVKHRKCNAGISFENVKIPKQPYSKFPHKRLDRYPCFKSDNCSNQCSRFAERDEADAVIYANKLTQLNQEYVEWLRRKRLNKT